MEIINNMLIPVLDETGTKFEQGKVFLPQLILTADAAQAAFSVIKETMQQRDQAPVSKGKIVLATVKGDIHDIGKNIVKVLLETMAIRSSTSEKMFLVKQSLMLP